MTTLDEATPDELIAELHKRLKNEITPEDLTHEFWEFMRPTEKEFRDLGERLEVSVMDESDIQEEVQRIMKDTQTFKILVRLAYLENTTTIRDLNALQREARNELQANYNQHHSMGI